jgi:excisionase family DNA binding protein
MNKRQAPILTDLPPLLLTVQQAAELLGVGKDLVYALIKQGSLPAIDIAQSGQRQKLRIALAVLEQWIIEQTRQQNPDNDLITSIQNDVGKIDPLKQARKGRTSSGRVLALPTSTQRHYRPS